MDERKNQPAVVMGMQRIRRCGTCEWYELGRCHAGPPVLVNVHLSWEMPEVSESEWCGRWVQGASI